MIDYQQAHAELDHATASQIAAVAGELQARIDAEEPAPPGIEIVNGKPYMLNAKGGLEPVETVKAQHRLEDEVVRKVLAYAEPLSAQIARFREHTFDDVDQFVALLEQQYGAKRGGSKGNITLTTYDGLMKVVVQVADQITFGPELQVAKGLVDECLREWSTDSRPELRAIVDRAFNVEKAGRDNRADLLSLLRLEIADERWQRGMQAIKDSMKPIGTKRYVRIYRRSNANAAWEAVSIDAATA